VIGSGPQMPSDGAAHRGPIAWMARNSIAAHLAMIILLGGGVWTALTMQKEVDPPFELDIAEVLVNYPGAAPAEVEQGILLPVEEAARGVAGIKETRSVAREGSGTVQFERRGRSRELLEVMLREVADRQVARRGAHAAHGFEFPGQQLHAGGLAGTIAPEQRDAIPGRERETDLLEQRPATVAGALLLQHQQRPRQPVRLEEGEFEGR